MGGPGSLQLKIPQLRQPLPIDLGDGTDFIKLC